MFGSPEEFIERGIGFCVTHRGRIVSAATSFAICSRGIEVQISTSSPYRRRGLATATAVALALCCLDRGLEPHWDAGNPISMMLARKLGYKLREVYRMLVLG